MATLRLKYVKRYESAGSVYVYFRRPGFPKTRLPGAIGSSEFMAAYAAALEGVTPSPLQPVRVIADRNATGTVHAAIAAYKASNAWRDGLKASTQAARAAILARIAERVGDLPIAKLERKHVVAMRDGLKPHAAKNFIKALRGLLDYAVDAELVTENVAADVKVKLPKSDGFHSWTEAEISQYEGKHEIGTKARLALALALYTGQRCGDVATIGRQHVRDGAIHLRQEKTSTTLRIPIHPDLAAILAATDCGELTFLVTRRGLAYRPTDLSEQFGAWCDEAELPKALNPASGKIERLCVMHGLRKAAATRLSDAGCSPQEIAAITGHKGLGMVELYTKARDQAELASLAMERMKRRARSGNESV